MKTQLYLIRHGEAYSNIEHTLAGPRSDQGLTERGLAQARALAERLSSGAIQADVLYASTLRRAQMTAELVAEALDLSINWDDELHELRPGQADGLHVDEARARFETFHRFLRETYAPIAPDGESWGSFQMRASATLERLIKAHHGQSIVIVAHGGIIEASFFHLLGLAPEVRTRMAFHVRNTAITHWVYHESFSGHWQWHLVAHNDCMHLERMAQE